jgi:hypothetical protein
MPVVGTSWTSPLVKQTLPAGPECPLMAKGQIRIIEQSKRTLGH